MNAEQWDRIARQFESGQLVPANGWEAWEQQAVREAMLIRQIVADPRVSSLLEVGCGVARLTPILSALFPRVIATDTSAEMRRVTAALCAHLPNVEVREPGGIEADAAVVWGSLFDGDWSDHDAAGLVLELAACCGYVVVQTDRPFIVAFDNVLLGIDDWTIIGPAAWWAQLKEHRDDPEPPDPGAGRPPAVPHPQHRHDHEEVARAAPRLG